MSSPWADLPDAERKAKERSALREFAFLIAAGLAFAVVVVWIATR